MLNESLSEAQTRKLIIDDLLAKTGWNLQDHSQVIEEFEITGTSASNYHILQKKEEGDKSGFSDYLLLDRAGDPLAVIEAKRTSRDPIEGKQQAEDYANGIKKACGKDPFIFMTNGYEIWFWNRQRYAPAMVHGFFTQSDLEHLRFQNEFRKDPHDIPINPAIIDRDYQVEAIKRVFNCLIQNKRKSLLIMAKGSGKTGLLWP